jgi:hypothetical protein
MAIRYAITTGNWSSTSTWDGGTLPTSVDDVYADGKIVTIEQNIIVNSLTTKTRTGGIAGGQFLVNNTSGLYITASEIVSGTTDCLKVNLTPTQVINIAADINNATFSTFGAFITGGTTNLIGTVSCGRKTTGTSVHYAMYSTNGILNMNGNVYGGTPSNSSNAYGLYLNNHTLYITGNIFGGNGTNCVAVYGINNSGVYATGSILGGPNTSSIGLYTSQTNKKISINGNIVAGTGSNAYGAQIWQGGTVEIIGDVYGSSNISSIGLYIGPTPFIGSISMTGSIYGGSNNGAFGVYLQSITSASTITGNIFGGSNNSGNGSVGLWTAGAGMGNLVINGTVSSGASPGMRVNSSGAGVTTINGKIISGLNYGLYHTFTTNVVINGTQSNSSSLLYVPIYKESSSGNMTINGNILGSTNSIYPSICIVDNSSTSLTINGNITNGIFGNALGLVYLLRATTLNVNGNVSAGTASNSLAIYSASSVGPVNININGNITAGTGTINSPAISLIGNSVTQLLTITGSVIASTQSPAISSPSLSHKTTVHGNLINTADMMAFFGYKLNIGTTQSTAWNIQTSSGSRSISTSNASNGVPQTSDVRSGVLYGTTNEFTGTLAVPTASYVSAGVSVDNTVGTAVLNISDVGALLAAYVV